MKFMRRTEEQRLGKNYVSLTQWPSQTLKQMEERKEQTNPANQVLARSVRPEKEVKGIDKIICFQMIRYYTLKDPNDSNS